MILLVHGWAGKLLNLLLLLHPWQQISFSLNAVLQFSLVASGSQQSYTSIC